MIHRHDDAGPVPGPLGHFVVGSIPDLRRDPLQTLVDAWRRHGDVVRFRLVGPLQAYLVAHPDGVKHVLQDANQNYPKHPRNIGKLRASIGNGLLTSDGATWLRHRRLIQPAFHRDRIEAFGTIMTDATRAMLVRWEAVARNEGSVDIFREMMHLALKIIAQVMFSVDVATDAGTLVRGLSIALEDTMRRKRSYVELPRWLPLPSNRRFLAARKDLDAIVYRIIEERLRSGLDRGDLLSMLLGASDGGGATRMTNEQVRDEVMTTILAGYEAIAVALTWTWYLLSIHPDAGRRLRTELADTLGGREPAVSDLPRLSYARMVIEEAMRLYPPASAMSRIALTDDVIGGFHIPAGACILLSPYVTHRHPSFWPNPEGFQPERFDPEISAGRPRFAYFPFGGGPRQCIGNHLAMMEAQLILTTVARSFRLDVVPGLRVIAHPMVTLRTRDDLWMRVTSLTHPEGSVVGKDSARADRAMPNGLG